MADTLGAFEQAVLLAILRRGDNAYGRAVLNEVQTRLDRSVAAGAVHATLERLERKGLIGSRLGTGTPSAAAGPDGSIGSAQGLRALNDARETVATACGEASSGR